MEQKRERLISCKDVSIGYDGKVVVSNLNFEICTGDYLCIVGENGTGKSTLIKTLLHLQNTLDGVMEYDSSLKTHDIGYLPQQTMVQRDFPATVWEVALSGTLSQLGRKMFYGRREKQMAKEKLMELGMWEHRKECYRRLSGGQQQRTLLARTLCAASKVILLDEPVTGLDPKVTLELYCLIRKLNHGGITVIMVSHDMQAISYATHVLHVNKENSFYGTKEQYMKQKMAQKFLMMEENNDGRCD